jgi:integration host factor subunit beta
LVTSNSHTNLQDDEIKAITKHIFDLLAQTLINGARIEIRGFGSFNTKQRTGTVRNPKTGDTIEDSKICHNKSVHFKPGKEFKRMIKGNVDETS